MGRAALVLIAVLLGFTTGARAGRDCRPGSLTVEIFRAAERTALAVRDRLERSGARVVVLARAGADLSRYALRYSHLGFAVRRHPRGRWIVVHELNDCAGPSSAIYDQGLINFFLDDPFTLDALLMAPAPAIQRRLETMLLGAAALRVHQPRYSLIAHPWSLRYQNSNQWGLELLALARHGAPPTAGRGEAQRLLRAGGFVPDPIAIGALERLGAGLMRANVRFDDHPPSERASGRFSVVTVRAVARWLEDSGALAWRAELREARSNPP